MRVRITRGSSIQLLVTGIAMIAILSACSSGQSGGSLGPSAKAVAAELSENVSDLPEANGELTQHSSGGSVTIDVTWQNPNASGPLQFTVAMNTHSVNLDGYDLGQLAILKNDQGQEVRPQSWEGPQGGHHRSGTLTFPAADGSGRPIAGPATRSLELIIRDVAGVRERRLRWETPS